MDLNYLYKIPTREVALKLGIKVASNKSAHCFNPQKHKNNDANPPLIFGNNNTWNCAVCSFNFNGKPYGNNIDLVKEYLGIDFKETLNWFSSNFNFSNSEYNIQSNKEYHRNHSRLTPRDIEIYNDFIRLSGKIEGAYLQYLLDRKLSKFIIDEYKITNVKINVTEKLKQLYDIDALIDSGIFSVSRKNKQPYFTFKNHPIVFPFYYSDDVIFLQGRSINNQRIKYKNLPKEILFPYNVNILLHPDITYENVLITEGVIDTLSLLDKNINAVGIIGAKNFKKEWIDLFNIYEVNPVIALDEDQRFKESETKLPNIFNKPLDRIYPSDFGDGKDWNEILIQEIK